ncbi:MAG: DNA replication and repair protein RecF [Opitutaceae bacterium]|nr:DNA replication and repair protein RecF [Opitutaceae bacterium]
MQLIRITVQDFRNLSWVDLEILGQRLFLVGKNGQGKTNLLEAMALAGALRSFRTSDARDLIAHGRPQANLAWEWRSESGQQKVVATFRPGSKELTVDGEKIPRVGDYLGRFSTVVFSSQDLQLIRGGPALRRRWIDSLLATAHPEYLRNLQRYTRALEARNRLLRDAAKDAELAAFEREMAGEAAELVVCRRKASVPLSLLVKDAATAVAEPGESTAFSLRIEDGADRQDYWLSTWEETREKDRILKSTTAGPHRDDVKLQINGHSARDYGSEGQQRTLVLAMRLAEARYLRDITGRRPLVLADDVLGELDSGRRHRFWLALGEEHQVVATGTELPTDAGQPWQIVEIEAGKLINR